LERLFFEKYLIISLHYNIYKEALEGCLESDISHGKEIPPPNYTEGYPVTVASHIALSLRLRELRGGQSQTNIAQKLGLSYQAYQRLENPRKANPIVKTLEKIAHIYGKVPCRRTGNVYKTKRQN
jgi:antitoxin HicB